MTGSGLIIPDYAIPDAVMVAHYRCDILPVLEGIAAAVSHHCGVILLSQDEAFSRAFVERMERPGRFAILTAPYDTPWIRDRSPVAVRTGGGVRWLRPRVEDMGRPADDALFARLCAVPVEPVPLSCLPRGNMVAGADGLMLVTRDVLRVNGLRRKDLDAYSSPLGIRTWLVFTGFAREQTGHADVHVRVLDAHLYALAWNLSVKADRARMVRLEEAIVRHDPKARILRIPIRSRGKRYASLVNWIQIGRRIVAPRFAETPEQDMIRMRDTLGAEGFSVEFVSSPTAHLGGALHCLSASIFV